jgi:hypothetical protein
MTTMTSTMLMKTALIGMTPKLVSLPNRQRAF